LDDFESGDHLGSYTPGAKANSTTDFACGAGSSWSLLVHHDSGAVSSFYHTQNQDASRFSWLKIRFDFLMDGFDHMDALFLELPLDGGATYFIVADWAKDNRGLSQLDVCYSETVALNARAFDRITFGDQVGLRFRASANALNDKVVIDNIWFQGYLDSGYMQPTGTPSSGPSTIPSWVPSVVLSKSPIKSPTGPTVSPSMKPTPLAVSISSQHPSSSPTNLPTNPLTIDEICPVERLYPPSKHEILPYTAPLPTPGVVMTYRRYLAWRSLIKQMQKEICMLMSFRTRINFPSKSFVSSDTPRRVKW
jgi:hypothetical protein